MHVAIGPLGLGFETVEGEPIEAGDWRVTPVARSASLMLGREGMPGGGGFVWTWPVAVKVDGRGRQERLRILDLTRLPGIASTTVALGALTLRRAPGARERGRKEV